MNFLPIRKYDFLVKINIIRCGFVFLFIDCIDMKVSALIEDELIQDVIDISGAKNITEALRIALKDYRSRKLTRNYANSIAAEQLEFTYGAKELRDLNQE